MELLSDFALKDGTITCYEIMKYVKPETFHFTHLNDCENTVNHLGVVAQGFERVMPKMGRHHSDR